MEGYIFTRKDLRKQKQEEVKYIIAIQIASKYIPYLKHPSNIARVQYEKLRALYHDENYEGAYIIGTELINQYKKGALKSGSQQAVDFGWADLDFSMVYAYTVSSCLFTNRYSTGLNLSSECIESEKLQHDYYIEHHAWLLQALNRENEACSFLTKKYMDGNEKARNLYHEYCK